MMLRDLQVLTPEFMMAVGGMALLMLGVFAGEHSHRVLSRAAMVLLLITGVAVVVGQGVAAFGTALIVDEFARLIKLLVLGGAVLVLWMSEDFLERARIGRFEFPILVIFSVLGMMLMASAGDFLTLYLGLELQSLALYVLAAFDRDDRVREADVEHQRAVQHVPLGKLPEGIAHFAREHAKRAQVARQRHADRGRERLVI